MKELGEKLIGHAEHLLNCFRGLQETYAFLRSMMFDKDVVGSRGSGAKARGFVAIRNTLFYTCVQDVVKLTFDKDDRTPSIYNIVRKLACESTRSWLRERYAIWDLPLDEYSDDVKAVLLQMNAKEEEKRRKHFDETYQSILQHWNAIEQQPWIEGFKMVRDKITAHLELRKVDGKYRRVDVGQLGLKWGDVGEALQVMQPLVNDLYLIVCNTASFPEEFEATLDKEAKNYWL